MEFRVDASENAGAAVVAPAGDIDLHTAPRVRESIDRARNDGRTVIVVDLSNVEFLDSSGLGMFVAAHHELTGDGGALRIACPPPHAQKVFRITRLAEVIPIFDSVQEAASG